MPAATAYLLDVNVLVALMHERHQHSPAAVAWLGGLDGPASVLVCRAAQMGALRILSNVAVMGEDVTTAAAFWDGWDRMLSDDRLAFVDEPAGFEAVWRARSQGLQPGQRVETDTYLAALAEAGGWTMATFDRGFQRFADLPLAVLAV